MSLLTAPKVGAAYEPQTQRLILTADALLDRVTYGIVFRRIQWIGSYKFALEGFQTTPQSVENYPVERFVPTPSNSRFLKSVIIVTADFPNGRVVPVHWLGGTKSEDQTAAIEKDVSNPDDGQVIPTVVPITESLKAPFTIESRINEFVFLEKIDHAFLELIGANVIDGRIMWEILPKQAGHTSVTVRSEKGLGGPVFEVDYLITIGVPNEAVDGTLQGSAKADLILSYVGKVNVILEHVKKSHPEAEVHSAKAYTHNTSSGVENIGALFDYFVTFRIKDNKFLTQELLGKYFLKPIVTEAFPGLPDVKWPVEFQAEEALKMLRERGLTKNFVGVTLESTIGGPDPHFSQTWVYIFRLVDGSEERVTLVQG